MRISIIAALLLLLFGLYYANDNTLTIDGQVYTKNRAFESTKGTMARGCAAVSPECGHCVSDVNKSPGHMRNGSCYTR